MEWTDEGIVLGVRRHGETSAIVELLTRGHGRHLGLVRGGAGKRMRPLLQPGNSVTTVWRARLDEHLGYYAIEGTRLRAATLLASAHATYGVTHLASLVRLLPERDPHEDIFEMLDRTLDDFDRNPAARYRGGRASRTGTACCGCRRSCAKARAGQTAGRTRTCKTGFA
jgi:DNA repair protein RecO (recombination protein O)